MRRRFVDYLIATAALKVGWETITRAATTPKDAPRK